MLPGFQQRYPQVQLELDFNDRIVDVVSEGPDAVIRSGELADSSLTARRLGGFRFILCAAPGYLQMHGTPGDVGDLRMHTALRFRYPTTGKLHPWQLPGIEGDAGARLPTAMTCNNMEAVLAAAIGCMGLAGCLTSSQPTRWPMAACNRCCPHCPRTRGSSRCCGPVGAIPVHACGCSSTTPLRTFSAAPGKGDGGD